MNYIEIQLHLTPFRPFNEILMVELGEIGFESFVEEENEALLKGYITADEYDLSRVKSCCSKFKEELEYRLSVVEIEKENWNKKWEENFESVEVGQFCYVHAPFHEKKEAFTYQILIEPKMSFGTGHHQTTQMMIELMEGIDFTGKKVLDMGSGTGILAILAKKMGASKVDAIDIEEWAYENMIENFERNHVNANAYHGGVELIEGLNENYDVILANINKNILLDQFSVYNKVLNNGGALLLSGFYQNDQQDLLNSPHLAEFQLDKHKNKENWLSLKLEKK